jgi:hypothetical protein
MGMEQMFQMGGFRRVEATGTDPAEAHGFVKASIIALKDEALSHRSFRVLISLESYCWGDDRESWPTNRTLGLRAGGIGPEAVRQALRELERRGYLQLVPDTTRWRGSRIVLLYLLKRAEEAVE